MFFAQLPMSAFHPKLTVQPQAFERGALSSNDIAERIPRCEKCSMTRLELRTANLFTAGKAYAMAVGRLVPAANKSAALQLPISLLSGFAFELSLKAVVSSTSASDKSLRNIGHNLRLAWEQAIATGYSPPLSKGIFECIEALADSHEELSYRYIDPMAAQIKTAKLNVLVPALAAHIDAVEDQFDVWKRRSP